MDSDRATPPHSRFDLEAVLRSPLWRRVLIAGGVVLLTLATSLPLYELLVRQRGVPFHEILAPRLLLYGLWGILVEPILHTARWLRDRSPLFSVRALLLIPFSLVVASGMSRMDDWTNERSRQRYATFQRPGVTEDPQEEGERRGRRRGEEGRGEGRPERDGPRDGLRDGARDGLRDGPRDGSREGRRPSRRDREEALRRGRWLDRGRRIRSFSRSLTELWLLLALGAGVEAFLKGRRSEREAGVLALESARLETELARAQLGSLSRQLNPHFLFNALHSIGGLVRLGDEERALAVLSDMSSLLRRTLELGERDQQSVRDELAIVERYLALEAVRLGERLRTSIQATPETLDLALPSLLLLPLVENAVRHGIAPLEDGGQVELGVRCEADTLIIEVCDDGAGLSSETSEGDEERTSTGIGLRNGRDRLSLMYGDEASLILEERPEGGVRVTVRLPARRFDGSDEDFPAEETA